MRVHRLEQPAGLPCSFKVLKSLSTRHCMSGQAYTKAIRCDSYEKHQVNLKGTTTWLIPRRCDAPQKHVKSMGARVDRARSKETPEYGTERFARIHT